METPPGPDATPPPPDRARFVTLAALAVGVVTTAVSWNLLRPAPADRAGPLRLAVLPFIDDSDGRTEQALARGLAQHVIRALGTCADLRVLAPDSAQDVFADSDERAAEIARGLDAQILLLGRVRRTGPAVRLNVRALRLPAQRAIFEREFSAPIETASELPTQVAREAASALGLSPAAACPTSG